jgi:phosphoserine aminotransferase
MMHNFTAGPSIMPKIVMEQAAEGILNYNNTGLSLLEVSHRSKTFMAVIEEALALVKTLMNLGNDYEVCFLQGGATQQFMQVPLHFLAANKYASYIDTGVWSNKAIKQAQQYGGVHVVASSEATNYNFIPKTHEVFNSDSYLQITTNNTIFGSQYNFIPQTNLPLVADMSSDIFSRPTNYAAYDLIYAGAQKNMGTAGTTLVVVKKDFLQKTVRPVPSILNYAEHIKNDSLLNTPPVFAIYVALLTLRWVQQKTVATLGVENEAKAKLLYNTIDALPMFKGTIATEDRSQMNACFVLENETLEKEFLQLCETENMVGVKGHRLSGGLRVSMYNALPISSVEAFTNLMQHFAAKKG